MLKKRRIHAEEMCASRSAPFPVLLLARELGFRHLQHAAAAAATEPVQQLLVENTLHLIRPQVSVFERNGVRRGLKTQQGYSGMRLCRSCCTMSIVLQMWPPVIKACLDVLLPCLAAEFRHT